MSTNSDTSSAQSIKMGQEDEDASYQGDSEENRSRNNRSRTDATQGLIDILLNQKSKSRNSKTCARYAINVHC